MRSRLLLSMRSVRYTWCERRIDWVEARDTMGVWESVKMTSER
jgi:hypothetical protein